MNMLNKTRLVALALLVSQSSAFAGTDDLKKFFTDTLPNHKVAGPVWRWVNPMEKSTQNDAKYTKTKKNEITKAWIKKQPNMVDLDVAKGADVEDKYIDQLSNKVAPIFKLKAANTKDGQPLIATDGTELVALNAEVTKEQIDGIKLATDDTKAADTVKLADGQKIEELFKVSKHVAKEDIKTKVAEPNLYMVGEDGNGKPEAVNIDLSKNIGLGKYYDKAVTGIFDKLGIHFGRVNNWAKQGEWHRNVWMHWTARMALTAGLATGAIKLGKMVFKAVTAAEEIQDEANLSVVLEAAQVIVDSEEKDAKLADQMQDDVVQELAAALDATSREALEKAVTEFDSAIAGVEGAPRVEDALKALSEIIMQCNQELAITIEDEDN